MKKKLINSQLYNANTFLMYRNQLLTLAENVFEFKNLPDEIDVEYMNRILVQNGSIAFFKDDVLGVIALPYTIIGALDIYGRPQTIMARAFNGRYYRKLEKSEFVIMYDNNSLTPIYLDILQMAERIALSKRTVDINIYQQRTPRIFKTSKDKELTLKRILNEVDGLVENVITYDSLDIDDMNVVLAPAPYVVDKIDEHLKEEWSEFFRLIGISSLQEHKRERLISDEVTANLGGTVAARYSRFQPREKAIRLINKKFGTNIRVRFYDGIPSNDEEDNKKEIEYESEGDEDVFISND